MSVRFLNPHNVLHGAVTIAKCREARVSSQCAEVRQLIGDDAVFPEAVEATEPHCEIEIVTEDVVAALSIVPGTKSTLTFDAADAEGGDDVTVTGLNAVYLGPSEDFGETKAGPGVATMRFVCWSSTGSTNPISIS